MQYTTKAPAEASATPEAIIASEALPGGYSEPDYTADIEAAEAQIPDPPPGPERYRFIPDDDLDLPDIDTEKDIIQDWIPSKSQVMLFGPPGSGKSYIALDWAYRVATGAGTWANAPELDRPGFEVIKAPVLYLLGEGHNGIKRRRAAWRQHYGNHERAMIAFSNMAEHLDDADGYQTVSEAIREAIKGQFGGQTPALVVVDTLHRHNAGNENDSQEAGRLIANCGRLIHEFNCTVLLVHHTGLGDQGRARGSSAFNGALDMEIRCSKEKGSNLVTLKQTKSKEAEAMPPVNFELHTVTIPGKLDAYGREVKSAVVLPSAARPEQAEAKYKSEPKALQWLNKAYDKTLQNEPKYTPDGTLEGVTYDALRACFFEIYPEESYDAKRNAFKRAVRDYSIGNFDVKNNIFKSKRLGLIDNSIAKPFNESGQNRTKQDICPELSESNHGQRTESGTDRTGHTPKGVSCPVLCPDDQKTEKKNPVKPNKGKKKQDSKRAEK